jgi:putative transposase
VAWGFTEQGERVLLAVMLGMRESHEDWLALGRDLIARGLGAPLLIVADGAPGLIKAIEQCWPASDRQRAWREVRGRDALRLKAHDARPADDLLPLDLRGAERRPLRAPSRVTGRRARRA